MEYSKKIILVTENTRIATPIKHALKKHGIEIESEYLNLHSLIIMRKGIARAGRTTFIRNEFSRFVKERGFPAAFIMDAQVDLGFQPKDDPGMIKLLKTHLISYIIFSKGREYEKLKGSFILLTRGKSFGERYGIGRDPHKVLDQLMTENPTINSYINELKKDRKRFDELFFIKLLDSETSSDTITEFVDAFLKGVIIRQNPPGAAAETKAPEKTEADDKPARIVYKIDADTVYDDGDIVPASVELYAGCKENEFYIVGSWVSKTELDVSRKIAGAIQNGLGESKRFSFNDEIVVNIDDRCVIDKNTTLSIAQLFAKNLAAYKKIKIIISESHRDLVTKSRGFPMIKGMIPGDA